MAIAAGTGKGGNKGQMDVSAKNQVGARLQPAVDRLLVSAQQILAIFLAGDVYGLVRDDNAQLARSGLAQLVGHLLPLASGHCPLNVAVAACGAHPDHQQVRRLKHGFEVVAEHFPIAAVGRKSAGSHVEEGKDRKSTRLNSSHVATSYAVFCLKKKKKNSALPRKPPKLR